ncbi:hypothetical protein Hdeb2414_s0006g00191391 [Helianthus debilis subsp. tardiflorus]
MDSYVYKYSVCIKDKKESDKLSEPMVWIGIYIAVASCVCIIAMAADLVHGFRNKKFWFPCKYFSLNAASITVIAIAMKLPVDLTSPMPRYPDQEAKIVSLMFMYTMMVNLMPSLASMDDKTLLANMIGLCILVITICVNICIQVNTGVIHNAFIVSGDFDVYYGFAYPACYIMCMILFLLMIMISLSLTISTSKEIIESKYQATNKILLNDESPENMPTVGKLRRHVRRYWVMAETGSPQFGVASNPLCTASGVFCVLILLDYYAMVSYILFGPYGIKTLLFDFKLESPYKWSTTAILITHSIGAVVGSIAPISRCFSVFSFKLGTKWVEKYIIESDTDIFWIQKLHEWKQSPVVFLSNNRRLKSFIYISKNIFLSLFIWFQTVIVGLCKFYCFVMTIVPALMISCFTYKTQLAEETDDIDEDLSRYVLQIDNEPELLKKALKGISKSLNSFISKAEKEQNNNLLELLDKFTEFKGVEIFDTDNVQSLLPAELVNSWSLPIVTLTCVAVSIPNIREDIVKSLLSSVGEGLSFTHLVEESLNCTSEYVNLRKASMSLWHEVEYKCKWLHNPLAKNVFDGKAATEIVEWFSDKAKEIVTKINERTNRELAENPPYKLLAANSMYRITQTILLRFQSNTEPITKKQLFSHLNGMIADIFCACFTNLPRVITMRCHESVIEKREASVRVAAKLLGKTTKIIEKLEKCDKVPSMDDDKMAYIDEWRLYMKQSIP